MGTGTTEEHAKKRTRKAVKFTRGVEVCADTSHTCIAILLSQSTHYYFTFLPILLVHL